MEITFLLPNIGISGGSRVVFEHANHLVELGHKVSVVYPAFLISTGEKEHDFKSLTRRFFSAIKNFRFENYLDWFDIKADLIRVPTLAERYIPDADVIIATWWETAYYVERYSKQKGEKFYFIQHYEIWGGPKDKVEKTYRMGFHNIVISTWLKEILKKLRVEVEILIPNGINFQDFYPEEVGKKDNKFRILIPYRREKWKGIEDGVKAFEIAKKRQPNLQLVMFGPKPRKNELPSETEFHLLPVRNRLRRLYNSCDIFLFPSHCEGFGLPPMEAMACKCAVVTTNVGAVPDYAIPGKTALVSEPGDIKGLAQNIIRLIEDDSEKERIAENGHKYIQQFTWSKAAGKLEQVFKKYVYEDK